jgi:hypothetical protein
VVLVLSALILGERTGGASIAGILLSFMGIVLLVVRDSESGWNFQGSLLRDLLIGGAVMSASLYMIFARDLGRRYSSMDITFVQIVYGAVFFSLPLIWETALSLKSTHTATIMASNINSGAGHIDLERRWRLYLPWSDATCNPNLAGQTSHALACRIRHRLLQFNRIADNHKSPINRLGFRRHDLSLF